MIKDKVKALFAIRGISQTEYADKKGIVKQQLNKTINRGNVRAKDLIEYADFTGTKLAFLDENDKPIVVFDINDID